MTTVLALSPFVLVYRLSRELRTLGALFVEAFLGFCEARLGSVRNPSRIRLDRVP